jgi:hypothetical protein
VLCWNEFELSDFHSHSIIFFSRRLRTVFAFVDPGIISIWMGHGRLYTENNLCDQEGFTIVGQNR